jgi:aryl-alcohol dehydrogenase-like predicted oxidoreductase
MGRSGLKVSRLGLGTMNFGMVTDEAEAYRIMDAAIDAGINLFDTADVYGGPQKPDIEKGYGISEEIIGRWLAKSGNRPRLVLATKVYQPMDFGVNDRRLSAYHIRRACEDSLRRLQTDHIDRRTPWEEIWQAMELLVQQGKVSYIGGSNFAGWDIATAQGVAKARHFMGLISEQSVYNLSARSLELEVIPACRYHGLGLIPYSPIAGGLLGEGALQKASQSRRLRVREKAERFRTNLEAYDALCRELDEKPGDVATAWLLQNPDVTAPIVGPRIVEQLTGSLRALEVKLTSETLERLDKIWPGPGGEAPVAYAW